MAWKTEMPYQNANSTLWTEPLWFSLSVPRWLHFPTKLVSAPLPPPLLLHPPPAPPFSFPHVFLKAEICFSSAGSRANRLSFPCQRQISSNSLPFALLLTRAFWVVLWHSVVAAMLYLRYWATNLTCWSPFGNKGFWCWNVIWNTFWFYISNRTIRRLLLH